MLVQKAMTVICSKILRRCAASGRIYRRRLSIEGIEVPRDQKRAHALHEGVPQTFLLISESNVDYSSWIAEGRTRLIPKPGEFSSVNEG